MSLELFTPGLAKVAGTAAAGFPLQNATPTILSWTAPNDGNLHRVAVFAALDVTSPETGGEIDISFVAPSGNAGSGVLAGGGHGIVTLPVNPYLVTVKPGSVFTVLQGAALTAGAATLWAELWAA